jgi:hypothetical protein
LHVGIDPMDFVLGLCIRNRAALASLGRAILSILFLCGAHSDRLCTVAQTEPAAVRSTSLARTLDILSLTADRIRGRFAEGSVGVVFDSTKNDATAFLVIETLQGEEMLSAKRNDSGIVIALDGGRFQVEIRNEDLVALKRAHEDGSIASLLQAPASELRTPLQTVTKAQGSVDALDNIRHAPEYALLPSVSWELGRLGITGQRFPPALAIHAVGMAAARTLQIDPRVSSPASQRTLPPDLSDWLSTVGAVSNCDDPATIEKHGECPAQCKASPDPEHECVGMCGRGCDNCWNWVCGDCCYHDFCAIHDAATGACEKLSDLGLCVIAILPWYFAVLGCG